MRPLLALVGLLCFVAGVAAAPTPAEVVGADPFSLLSASSDSALSLQDSKTAAGTRAILAPYVRGKRADQLLRLLPSAESGWYAVAVNGTGRVLEVQDQSRDAVARDPAVLLVDAAPRDAQKWRLEAESPGRFRLVSKVRGLALAATGGVRPAVTVLPAAGAAEQRWRVHLEPERLADPSSAGGAATGGAATGGAATGGAATEGAATEGVPAGSLAERFPTLARQLQANRESFFDGVLAARRLEDYCSLGGAELGKGMGIVVLDRVYTLAPDERNWALTLLLWLLSQAAYTRGDPITAALALANASVYAAGDEEVRAEIRRDVVAHYKLYRSVTEWQKEWALAYRLASQPFLAKVLWCYRANQLEQAGPTLTLEEYRTFVDRIDVLEDMQGWVRSHDVGEAPSLRGAVLRIDSLFRVAYKYAHFMAMIRQWYAADAPLPENPTDDALYAYLTRPEVARSLPDWAREVLEDYRDGSYYVEVLGRRRDPQARMWVNYQWQLFRDTGTFRGDCGTETEVSMALWKAAGLVAIAMYHTGKDIGHAYPMYLDPVVGRFSSLQDLSFVVGKHGESADVTLHPMPLRLHERIPPLRPQPRTTALPYTRFALRGLDLSLLERMYLDRADGARPEAVFGAANAPAELRDTDRDGLRDEDELTLGTRPDDADTDHDGFSDSWELERGFDPRDAAAPSKADLGRVLVGHVVAIWSAPFGAGLEPVGGADPAATLPLFHVVRSDEAQYHFLLDAASGLCVAVLDRGKVVETPLTGSADQKWKLLFRDAGRFAIQSRADGRVLTLENGQELVVRAPRGTPDETWLIR